MVLLCPNRRKVAHFHWYVCIQDIDVDLSKKLLKLDSAVVIFHVYIFHIYIPVFTNTISLELLFTYCFVCLFEGG